MSSPKQFFLRLLFLTASLLLIVQAKGQAFGGNEAESGYQKELPAQSLQQMEENADLRSWDQGLVQKAPSKFQQKRLEKAIEKFQSRPNRPIPVVLIVLGLLLIILWGILLIATILAAGLAAFLILLVLTIVFSPIFILGLLLLIGGIVGQAV